MAGTITLWDLYLQVKNFQLKKPAQFMMLVLKDFPITCPGRFGISAYYMALFYWHYPFHFFSLLSASFQICTHKISGTYRQWKNKMNTFSPMASVASQCLGYRLCAKFRVVFKIPKVPNSLSVQISSSFINEAWYHFWPNI